MHIMTSISRSKGNQAMKLGQLVKYNMRNIFLEKSYRKYGGEKLPDPFLKTQKLRIFFTDYFCCMPC